MTVSFPSLIRWRLAQLSSHLVVALIALVVVGGATRVMEAGLACPDWPLCFGTWLPGRQMNIQVFLEWFHRLDAFLVSFVLLVQLCLSLRWRSHLPKWLPWVYGALVFLIGLQAVLGGLTVLQLLPTAVVTAHLFLGLTLVASMSALSQILLSLNGGDSPLWWRLMGTGSLVLVMTQCLIGGRMATAWAAQRCIQLGQSCQWLDFHRIFAMPVALFVLLFVVASFMDRGWPSSQWPFLLAITLLVIIQVCLGIVSVHFGLAQPLLTVAHDLAAALLVACLAALSFRKPPVSISKSSEMSSESFLEPCHG